MSVLIECLTLVIPLKELDIRYPGGRDAFLNAALALAEPPRFICSADPYLANLSFYSGEHAQPCIELLVENGFTAVEENRFLDFAYVDQHHGPTMPCDWLEWRQHPDGFTLAWLAGTEPGEMAVDEGWTPERSRAQQRFDIRDEPGRTLKLAEEDGIETWLDFKTGIQAVGLSAPSTSPPPPKSARVPRHSGDLFRFDDPKGPEREEPRSREKQAEDDEDDDIEELRRELEEQAAARRARQPLYHIVVDALRERKLRFGGDPEHSQVNLRFLGDAAAYSVSIHIDEQRGIVLCRLDLPVFVPEAVWPATYEALSYANYGMEIGNFEMDPVVGEMRFKAGIDVTGGTLGTTMVHNLIDACIQTTDRYFGAFMRVIYGGVAPDLAISEDELG